MNRFLDLVKTTNVPVENTKESATKVSHVKDVE